MQSIRLVRPRKVRVAWRCVGGGELAGWEFSETFNLTRRKGKERFKGFVFALSLCTENGEVDLDGCIGACLDVMALRRTMGQSSRIEIIHHML